MLRIFLFLAVNMAVIAVISVTFQLLGFEGLLAQNGIDLNLQALLVYAGIIGFGGAIISLLLSKWMAIKTMRVEVFSTPANQTERWLLARVAEHSAQCGIRTPDVGIFDSASPNAFATGWNRNSALVAVSTGLLQHMDSDEVDAVLAHEVSHIANGDMVTMTLLQGVVNTFVIFISRVIGHTVDRLVFKVERGHGPAFWIVSIIAELIIGFLASMLVMWFSRYREFRADAGAARLVGNRKMIAALERLRQFQHQSSMPDEMVAFAISAGKLHSLLASHPPLEKRIEALR